MEIAHFGHPGESKMKWLLRSKVWWLGMDAEIDDFVRNCRACQLSKGKETGDKIGFTELPNKPWDLVAMDFVSPSQNRHILVITDCYSRFVMAYPMTKTDAQAVIDLLAKIFDVFGTPLKVKADNGPPFQAKVLREWLLKQGVKIIHTVPYNPAENGLVERHNRGIQKAVACADIEEEDWKRAVRIYVTAYNSWPHSVLQEAPADVFFGRRWRGWLPEPDPEKKSLTDPTLRERDRASKVKRNAHEDQKRRAKPSEILQGDLVYLFDKTLNNGKGAWMRDRTYRVTHISWKNDFHIYCEATNDSKVRKAELLKKVVAEDREPERSKDDRKEKSMDVTEPNIVHDG